MDIYIKPMKKKKLIGRKTIFVKDLADVYVPGGNEESIKNVLVQTVGSGKDIRLLISVLDIVAAIHKKMPQATVNNLGEAEVLVEYFSKERKPVKEIQLLKAVMIFVVLFFGSAIAIMSYNSDGQIPSVFSQFYRMFFHEKTELPLLMHVPYALGITFGIIVFFNHFSKFYVTRDPTPIEVQMTTYEDETLESIKDALDKQSEAPGQ